MRLVYQQVRGYTLCTNPSPTTGVCLALMVYRERKKIVRGRSHLYRYDSYEYYCSVYVCKTGRLLKLDSRNWEKLRKTKRRIDGRKCILIPMQHPIPIK